MRNRRKRRQRPSACSSCLWTFSFSSKVPMGKRKKETFSLLRRLPLLVYMSQHTHTHTHVDCQWKSCFQHGIACGKRKNEVGKRSSTGVSRLLSFFFPHLSNTDIQRERASSWERTETALSIRYTSAIYCIPYISIAFSPPCSSTAFDWFIQEHWL